MFAFILLLLTSSYSLSSLRPLDKVAELRSVIESARANSHRNSFRIQLEPITYFSDGIIIENEDLELIGR